MSLQMQSAADWVRQRFHSNSNVIIDARSESEYAHDHIPGALNWPVLNDAERRGVGTLYKQTSPFDAQKLGASLVAANIGRHLQAHVLSLPKSWSPLVYCWRGGKRSQSLAHVLSQIGFSVRLLEGGYQAYRRALLADLPTRASQLRYIVITGATGCGKTRLLHALAQAGEQVLDLEHWAQHRSSILGALPHQPQPSQKHFDSLLWQQLQSYDPGRPVFVEAESKKVGNLTVPDALIEAMRLSPCMELKLPLAARVDLLMEDYRHWVDDQQAFSQRLTALLDLRGKESVTRWQAAISAGKLAEVVQDLLESHYDPLYLRSIDKNYAQAKNAPRIELPDAQASTLRHWVREAQSRKNWPHL